MPGQPLRLALASQSERFTYPSVEAPTVRSLGAIRCQRQ
jgi:hypothetical protein